MLTHININRTIPDIYPNKLKTSIFTLQKSQSFLPLQRQISRLHLGKYQQSKRPATRSLWIKCRIPY
jgi:hypothetical protein